MAFMQLPRCNRIHFFDPRAESEYWGDDLQVTRTNEFLQIDFDGQTVMDVADFAGDESIRWLPIAEGIEVRLVPEDCDHDPDLEEDGLSVRCCIEGIRLYFSDFRKGEK